MAYTMLVVEAVDPSWPWWKAGLTVLSLFVAALVFLLLPAADVTETEPHEGAPHPRVRT